MSKTEKIFEIPESVMSSVLGVLSQLPYGQIAPVMGRLQTVLASQVGAEGISVSDTKETE
jgi:hypothetical protein